MANIFMYKSQECIIETFDDFRKSIVRENIAIYIKTIAIGTIQ